MEKIEKSKCFSILDKRIWISKAFYASFYVAIGALFPYLPVYFKQLKLSYHQNGILIGIRPLIQFCFTPIWGACADKCSKSKAILMMSVLGWLASNFLLLLVPVNNDLKLCDVLNQVQEDSILYRKNRTSSQKSNFPFSAGINNKHDTTRDEHVNRQKFFSRVSPCLYTTVPFFPINLRGFQSVCSAIPQDLNPAIDRQGKPEVDIGNSQPLNQQPFQDMINRIDDSDQHVSCNSKEFIYLLLVTVIGTIIAAPAQALADTATLQSLHGETQKYGRVRLWGSLGWGIGGFSVGAAVSTNYQTNHCGESVIDYSPCFYVYAASMGVAFLCATQLEFDQTQDSPVILETDNSKSNKIIQGLKVFRSPQFCFVIFIAFFCGSATGFIETFLFWYLHELGGGQMLLSVINGLNCTAEVCVFFVTDRLLSFLGHINVIYLALLCYSIRFIYFYLIQSPWAVLPAELLQGITTAALWSSCVSFVGLHPGASNTVQGILNGVYMGLGFATGGFMGGILVHVAGMKLSFLIYSVASLCLLVIFVVLNKINVP